jgi:hypothetical protein
LSGTEQMAAGFVPVVVKNDLVQLELEGCFIMAFETGRVAVPLRAHRCRRRAPAGDIASRRRLGTRPMPRVPARDSARVRIVTPIWQL